jgi:hypothetical protein
MKHFGSQEGIIPLPVLIALAIAAIIGGLFGYKLGNGNIFAFGIGVGLVLLVGPNIIKRIKKLQKALRDD